MLRTPTPEAEQIKVRYACALAQLATSEESIQVPSVGDRAPRRLPRQSLAQAVQARYERSEEHTSELQPLMRISYAVFCLKNKKLTSNHNQQQPTQKRKQQ